MTRQNVLIIDDDRAFCEALAVRLRACGTDVTAAQNGVQGTWKALQGKPDAIVADFTMTGNGSFLLRVLKSIPATKNVPVFVVTGRPETRVRAEVMRLGAAACLPKPLDFERLRAALARSQT